MGLGNRQMVRQQKIGRSARIAPFSRAQLERVAPRSRHSHTSQQQRCRERQGRRQHPFPRKVGSDDDRRDQSDQNGITLRALNNAAATNAAKRTQSTMRTRRHAHTITSAAPSQRTVNSLAVKSCGFAHSSRFRVRLLDRVKQ